jgi:hypothetical protein
LRLKNISFETASSCIPDNCVIPVISTARYEPEAISQAGQVGTKKEKYSTGHLGFIFIYL